MEYRSSATFLGLPLLHIVTGTVVDGRYRRGVATAWLAIGDVAIGVLCACGGVAVGGVSLGGAALGLLPIGGLALGLLAVGGLAVGAVAIGGAAIACEAAIGGLAIAREYAIGGLALARHAMMGRGAAPSFSGIPHAPFRLSDAVVLIALIATLFMVAATIQRRREE